MADILAALDDLENEERAQKKTAASAAKRKTSQSSGRSGRPRTRSVKTTSHKSSHKKSSSDDLDNLPPPVIGTGRLTPIPKHRPSAPSPTQSRDSSLGGDSRRISFAEATPVPAKRRIYIPTKGASLATGFGFDPKLKKFGVLEGEWAQFSEEVVEAANVPTPTWAWFMHKKEFTNRLRKELQYEGDFKRVLRTWNKHFKRKGFQAWLELPVPKGGVDKSQSADQEDSDEETAIQSKKDAKKNAKKFRIVVSSSVEKGSSVYSRTSSLTRSISREGVVGNPQHRAAQKAHDKATEHAAEQEGKRPSVEDKEDGQVVEIDTVNSVDKENQLEKEDSTDKDFSDNKQGEFKDFNGMSGTNGKQKEVGSPTLTKTDSEEVESPFGTRPDPEQELQVPAVIKTDTEGVNSPLVTRSDPEKELEAPTIIKTDTNGVDRPLAMKSDPEPKLEKEEKATKDDKDEK